jgi:putative ABC transport system permease protein
MILTILRLVLASLFRNGLRTSLTILGIAIGIAAVMCTASIGAAGTARVQRQIDALGEDFLWIRAGSARVAGARTGAGGAQTLVPEDAVAIESSIHGVSMCSPQVGGREQIVVSGRNWNTQYRGVYPSFFEIRKRTLAAGTWFTDYELAGAARVLVLGMAASERLFGEENPVGRVVRMGRFPFQIVGVLDSRGSSRGGVDRDDVVFLPLTTSKKTLDRRDAVTDIMCAVAAPELMARAEAGVVALLRARHKLAEGAPNDFQIQRPLETLQLRAQSAGAMTAMLTAIGAVSLVVGGVGIMNIMLVSVTERKREIGIRLAIGARARDVRWQFLLEAAAIGLVGGIAGVGLGWASAEILSSHFGWETVVLAEVVATAVATAVGAGLVFGYYPAHRASNLDPMEAIRTEE